MILREIKRGEEPVDVSLSKYIRDYLDNAGYGDEGALERVQERVRAVSKFLADLVDRLGEKGLLTPRDIEGLLEPSREWYVERLEVEVERSEAKP